jgi:hypothetical protein
MKLTREQSKGCKLTDNDIYNIRREYEMCHNYSLLGRVYGVSASAIMYWVKEGCRQESLRCSTEYAKKMRESLTDDQRKKLNVRNKELNDARNENFPEYKLENKKRDKEYNARPEVIQHRKEYSKNYREDPKIKMMIKESQVEYRAKPEVIQHKLSYQKEYNTRPEVIKRNIAYQKEYNARPEVIQRRKEYHKTTYKNS